MKKITTILAVLCITISGYAQDFMHANTWVSSQLATGHLNQLDTYLSNEKYRGTQWAFVSEVLRHSKKHPLAYSLTHEGALANTHNRNHNANQLSGHYDFSYGMMRRWTVDINTTSTLHLYAGGFANANIGFCYNTKSNSNNPAQGYISANIGPKLMARYDFRLFNHPFIIGYEAQIPLVGLMFSPNYGQSYYEIFNEGNYDKNVVVTSLSTFQIRQQLSLDIPVTTHTAIRVGYLNGIDQSDVNNIKRHQWYNAAVIGVTISK